MADEHAPKPPIDEALHDDREIAVGTILRLGGLIALVTVATLGIAWVFTGSLQREERAEFREPPPIAAARPDAPSEPRLQPRPPEGLAALRAHEEQVLTTYRWIDADRGVVGIPIDRAIEALAAHPPASRDPASRPAESHITQPTQSSLGERGDEP